MLRTDGDGILKLKIKRELRKRANAPVPPDEHVTARTHLHTLANVEYQLDIADLTPGASVLGPHPMSSHDSDAAHGPAQHDLHAGARGGGQAAVPRSARALPGPHSVRSR